MNKNLKNAVIRIYDRMEQLVENELLVRGDYVREASENICGRNRYCAIGSLFAAGRVSRRDIEAYAPDRPFGLNQREMFLENRPSLKIALEYLDAQAQKVIDRRVGTNLEIASPAFFTSPLESLFEGSRDEARYSISKDEDDPVRPPGAATRSTMLSVIRKARSAVEAA